MASKPTNSSRIVSGEPAEDYRITQAREALETASAAVISGSLDYGCERLVERLADAIEGLLSRVDERAERDAVLEAAARQPFDDLARTVAEIKAERGQGR